jgi:hypothetical protein
MSLWITGSNILFPAWISPAGIWSLGKLYFFNFAIAIESQKGQEQVLKAQLYIFISA